MLNRTSFSVRKSNLGVAGIGDTLCVYNKSTCLFLSHFLYVECNIFSVFIFVQNDFHFAAYREKEKQMEKIRAKIAAKQQKKAR